MNKARKWIAAGLSVALCLCGIGGIHSVFASGETTATAEETYLFKDFPTNTGNSGYDYYTAKSNVDYKLMAGLFDASAADYGLTAFDTGAGTATLTSSAIDGLSAADWQWKFAANSSVVTVLRAKTDGTIKVQMSYASEKITGWMEAYNTIYSVHRYNAGEQTLDTLVNYFHGTDSVSGNTETDFLVSALYDIEISVEQGDIVYYEIGSLAAGRNIQGMTNTQIVFIPAPEADDPLKGYGTQLDTFVATLDQADYTDESWAKIEGYVTAFKGGTYADDDALIAAFNTAKANIQAVECDSVAYYVKTYGAKLDSFVNLLYQEDYLADTWTAIQGYVSDFKAGEYQDQAAVAAAYNTAVAAIGAIKPNAEYTSQTYTIGDFPKQTGQNGFGYTERNNVRYKLMAGLFDSSKENYGLTPFDTWDGANTITSTGIAGLKVVNWRWDFAANTGVVIVMESKIEGIISFKWSTSSTFGGWNEPYNAIYSVYRYNAATQTLDTLVNFVHGTDTVSGRTESSFVQASVYDLNIMVKEGDVIYYEVGSLQARNLQSMQTSQIVATPLNDETAGAVYGELLDGYVAALTQENFTDESWALIESYVAAYRSETYATAVAALNAYEAAIAKIDGVEPDSISYFGALLDQIVSSLEEENYEAETWTAINNEVETFKNGEYENGAAIKAAYGQAKTSIEALQPDSLSYIRADLLAKIEGYYGSLNSSYYSAEDWETISAAYNAYVQEQESKTDKESLQSFYDEQFAVMKSVTADKQEIVYLDYPTLMSANNFGWIEGDVVDTKLFTGTVKDGIREFDVYNAAENKMYNSELFAEDPTCYVMTWKWYVGIGKGVIVAYRANVDCSVTIKNTRLADGGASNGWTADTVLNVYIVRNGVAKLIKTLKAPTTDEDFNGTFYAKAGDMIYIEFTTTTATSARNTESPYRTTAVADANGFDEDLYNEQNHDLPVEVQERIAEKKSALETYYAGLNEDDYSATNWLLLEDYIDQFVQKCETDVETVADVDALYESILASMKAVATKAQAAEELAQTLEGYVAELQAEYDALVKNNKYTDENRALLDQALQDGIAAVRAAKTKAAGNMAKSSALSAMRAVEKKESGGLSGGAIAGIVIGCVVVVAAVCAAVIFVRKKNNK